MNGRIYDPLVGRFLSADLLIENPANLQTFNRYTYVRNNPLTLIDPSGWAPITDEIRAALARDIQAAADVAELVHGPSNGNLDVANAQHRTFQAVLNKSQYVDFVVTEQSINAEGKAVNRQRYIDANGNEVSRFPAGSKRPDAMILTDSDHKAGILEGGGKTDLKGKVDAVADLKTGVEGIDPKWRTEVSERVGVSKSRIMEVRKGGNFGSSYERATGGTGRFAGRALGVADAVGMVQAAYSAARHEADRLNNQNPYVGQTQSGVKYSMMFDRYYWTILPISHLENHRIYFWNGPAAGMEIPVTRERWNDLNNQLKVEGSTYSDRF